MLEPVQSLWIGPKLSLIEQLCIKSFLANGNPFHLYVYDNVEGIPEGTTVLDANEVLPESQIFTSHSGSVAHFADWWRWTLLEKKGGIWVDMDMIALKAFDFSDDVVFGKESDVTANVSVLKFPASHPICTHMKKACENPNAFQPYDNMKWKIYKSYRYFTGNSRSNTRWGETGGPIGFTKTLIHYNMFNLAKPYFYFFPIYPLNWRSIYDESYQDIQEPLNNSYGVHIWNEFIRRDKRFSLNDSLNNNSLLSTYIKKYF